MHRLDGDFVAAGSILLLLSDNGSTASGFSGIVKHHGTFQLINYPPLYLQWIHYYGSVPTELHKIESSESSRILILLSSCKREIFPLNGICQASNLIIAKGQRQPLGKALQDANYHCRRGSKTGSGRSVIIC